MDRPARKTKVVSYSELKDFDDDEDFACTKAPPSKRAKEDMRQQPKKSSSKSSSQESNSQSSLSQKSRRPLDERLHDRDLEAAITLSLLNNTDVKKEESPLSKGDDWVQVPVDENTDPACLIRSNCSVDVAALGLDEITSEKGLYIKPKPSKAPTKEQRKKPDDEDFEPKLTPDSESDEDFSEPDESDDEEFSVKKVSKGKKKEKLKSSEKSKQPRPALKKEKDVLKASKSKTQGSAASTPLRSPPKAKVAPKRPAPAPAVPKSKPSMSLSPAGGRVPKWNPPGQIGKNPTSSQSPAGRSPGQGLRLGLSRLVRVKPLHPSVTSH